jgi:hypothetical protein
VATVLNSNESGGVMFGGEAFGSQAFGATGDELAVDEKPGGIAIGDLCGACSSGQSIDDICDD